MTIIIIIVTMLLRLSFIPKYVKIPLITLNRPFIQLGIIVINFTNPLQIYAIALKEPLTNICIIGTLMPTVLSKIVIPVNAIRRFIHVFRISIRDIPDTLLTKTAKPTIIIFSSNRRDTKKIKTINFIFIIAFFNKLNQRNIFNSY